MGMRVAGVAVLALLVLCSSRAVGHTESRCATAANRESVTKSTEAYQGESYRVERRRTVGSRRNVTVIEAKYPVPSQSEMTPGAAVVSDGRKLNSNRS